MIDNPNLSRILVEAALYRTVREIYNSDPGVGPHTATLLGDCFRSDRDDAALLQGKVRHRRR
jgi:hypothetical protein